MSGLLTGFLSRLCDEIEHSKRYTDKVEEMHSGGIPPEVDVNDIIRVLTLSKMTTVVFNTMSIFLSI